jgi:parallel beta-helix repeat protein
MSTSTVGFAKYALVAVALLLLTQLAAVPAQGQTPITSCGTTITAPGNYVLINSLSCRGRFAISITSPSGGVQLSLGGHGIVAMGRADTGINVSNSGDVQITGPGFIGGFINGISISGSSGPVEVSAVTASGNGTGFLSVSSLVVLRGNTASQGLAGFDILTSHACVFTGNTAFANRDYGILISGTGNQVTQNMVFDNGRGIATSSHNTTDNHISQNTAVGDSQFDLYEGNSTCVNTWSDNTFGTANLSCIH